MAFRKYMKLVPNECSEKTRNYIKCKLDDLDVSSRNLKLKFGMCKVDYIMFKHNRETLAAALRKRFPNSMVLLKGNKSIESPNCSNIFFQQNSYFYWAFGLQKPNLWGAIDVETGMSYIFYDYRVKGNQITSSYMNPKHIMEKYQIDKVMSSADMKLEISKLGRNIFLVLSNLDEKTLNGMTEEGVVRVLVDCGLWVCNTVLTPIFIKCRLVKSLEEQTIMAVAAKLNSEGIIFVLQNMKAGIPGFCAEALFRFYIMSSARHVSQARPVSCLAGCRIFCLDEGEYKHFSNDNLKPGDLCILNMGLVLRNYRANVIATVPVSGIFSDSQTVVYNIVLEIRSAMMKTLKPGITFAHLANIARRKMIEQMILNFILEGKVDDIMETGICDVFNPNGIGHFLGIDFYDCEEKSDNHSESHNTRKIEHWVACKGMVLALNSELYLNEVIIKQLQDTPAGVFLQSRYISNYFGIAARVQDVIIITSHSIKSLSSLPRTINEIHKTMSDKVNIAFKKHKKVRPPIQKSFLRINVGKYTAFHKKSMVLDENHVSKNLLKLRYDYEPKDDQRVDLDRVLKTINESREWKPMKYLNQVMEEVYSYPYKIQNMLDFVMIPLLPRRRRPSFIPYPKVSPLSQTKLKFPKEGYGCPYFDWNEDFESCEVLRDSCLE
ncbi:xaa-Pro dipeptidase-like [Halyomorpha halys]|uniref:xaa-Pro dipeptidase-like n=1 Tax=Halyomorpha halys TaxID=286706 RepID=UPI0034D33DE0